MQDKTRKDKLLSNCPWMMNFFVSFDTWPSLVGCQGTELTYDYGNEYVKNCKHLLV
jgi:hypothetical protein